MRTLLLLLLPLAASPQGLHDQKWLFDKYILLDFATEPPALSLEAPSPWLGPGDHNTSICDRDGNLLFYSGGCFVGNRLHQVMENGDHINSDYAYTGWCNYGDLPITHNNTIVPWPGDTNKYILFNLDMNPPVPPDIHLRPKFLYYHVVDMSANAGLGAVVEKKKVAVAHQFLSIGFVCAAKQSSGDGWWVVVPKSLSNCYFVVPVTASGVGAPQEQCLGMAFSEADSGGQATFSPDGTQYARIEADNGLTLMNFDAATGQFSDPRTLQYPTDYTFAHGACFSADSRYLYATAITRVHQFDTQADDVQTSRQQVGQIYPDSLLPGQGALASAKLGPNGKIYVATPGLHRYLSTIERPNCPGALCDFRPHNLLLPANNYAGINNLPHFRVPQQDYTCGTTGTAAAGEATTGIKAWPNPATESLTVLLPEGFAGGRLQLFSPLGRLVADSAPGPGAESAQVDLHGLPPGIYLLRAGVETLKIAVARQ